MSTSEIPRTSSLPPPMPFGPMTEQQASRQAQAAAIPPLIRANDVVPALASTDLTQRHSTAEQPATEVSFDTPTRLGNTLETALTQPIENYEQLSQEEQTQINSLAENLKFPNGRTLVHALRNLSPEGRQNWIKLLPNTANTHTAPQIRAAATQLAELAHSEVNALFTEIEAPAPRFNPEGLNGDAEWDAAGYLSVLNAFTEMQTAMPDHLLKELASRNENGMAFVRRHQPGRAENSDNFLEVLSSSMKNAHTDGVDDVYLYDAAFSMDPQDIINNPQVQEYIQNLSSDHPNRSHVRSFQELLNISLPEDRKIETTGQMGPETWAALAEFETQQALKQALDIVRDDPRMGTERRAQWVERIQEQQHTISTEGLLPNPDDFDWKGAAQTALKVAVPGLMAYDLAKRWLGKDEPSPPPVTNQSRTRDLLNELGSEGGLNRRSRAGLQTSLDTVNRGNSQTALRSEQLEMLISNWFGIIDSGQQFDFTEQVINHEVGHILQEQRNAEGNTLLDSWKNISFADFDRSQANTAAFMGATLETHANDGFASDYARVDPEEDFAESFRTFTRQPEQLLQQNPLKFLFMAGATGAYEGREPELVQIMRDQGFKDSEIQNHVRTLRGQRSEYYSEKTLHIAENILRAVDNAVTPALLGMFSRHEGLGSMLGFNDWAARKASGVAADMTADMDHNFDLSVSSMLGGMEGALNMDSSRVVHPSRDGYVMDWLRQQHEIVNNPDSNQHQRQSAQENIQRFSSEGVGVFPAGISKYFPANVTERYQDSSRRGVEVIMSALSATPGILNHWGQAVERASQAGNEQDSIRIEQRALREMTQLHEGLHTLSTSGDINVFARHTLGDSTYEKLPPAARSILSDPSLVELFSGRSGRVNLSGDVIQRALERVLTRRQDAVAAVQTALTEGSGDDLTRIQSVLERGDDGQVQILNNRRAPGKALDGIRRLVENLAVAQGQSKPCTDQKAQQILQDLLTGLNQTQMPAETIDAEASRRKIPLDNIGQVLAQQLNFNGNI